ncbi:dynamin family protein [uncultured Williamsia sp.]|uniref:dynamin family protein n=1 Tax=uncultured Williamsia sp. TaxID=259311 RepID=UPI0026274935|nr:dynamin family protein [uncultured Williamsia sp.]
MTGIVMDPVQEALDHGLRSLAGLGGDLVDHANRIGATLFSPPRVVIVGRLKAGKSTLVNALIGAPVAETAALEATRLVAVYQDGAPSRAEAVAVDGTRHPITLTRGQTARMPIEEERIAYINRWLPSAAIRDLTLIDTPGLATLTTRNETATRRVLIDGFEQTRTASVDADAAVFLFDSTPRADELAFLQELPLSPLNTLGVLSRADGFGEGALGSRDPIEQAAEHAGRVATRLAHAVSAVVPISGLMAQTSHTGALSEQHARTLAALSALDAEELVDELDRDDDGVIDARMRGELLDLLGEYGILHGRMIARDGAAALNQWLSQRSGVPMLHQLMQSSLSEFAILNRARRVIAYVDQLAYNHPARDQIRMIVHQMRTHPAMLRVALLDDLQKLLAADPYSGVVEEIRTLLLAADPAECVGLPAGSSTQDVHLHANQRLSAAQTQALSTATAAEDAALVDVARAYTALATTGRL